MTNPMSQIRHLEDVDSPALNELTQRQSDIEEKLDLTKNQAPNQLDAAENSNAITLDENISPIKTINPSIDKVTRHASANVIST